MQTLDAAHPIQRDVQPGRVLASRGTGPGMQLGWSGMTLAIDGRADVQKGRDVLRGGGPVACVMPVVTEFVTLLADFVTHSIGLTGISGLSGIRAGRFEEPGMCSVGSGMVLAIGDLAGATVVTLLAATASLPEWVAMDDRDRSCRDRRRHYLLRRDSLATCS